MKLGHPGALLESLNPAIRGEQIKFHVQVEQRKQISREAAKDAKKDKYLPFAHFATLREICFRCSTCT